MYSIAFLATTVALLTSNSKGNEIVESVGNLGLCIADKCLDSLGGLLKPPVTIVDNKAGDENESRVLNWHYDNGLLRAVTNRDNDQQDFDNGKADTSLCLGPQLSLLSKTSSMPHELILQDCPADNEDDPSWVMSKTRHMRFLITSKGTIQSLATVIDPETGQDVASTHPFCLTMIKDESDNNEKAYIADCQNFDHDGSILPESKDNDGTVSEVIARHQLFDIFGTYSGTFLMPLRRVWFYKEPMYLAYQIGLPKTPLEERDASIIISTPRLQILQEMYVDIARLDTVETGAIVSVKASLDGEMSASLRVYDGGNDVTVENNTFFMVTKYEGPIGKGPNGSYTIFAMILAGFVACFMISIVAEKLCMKKTRPEESNNDGKTVCISLEEEEEEDFPLEEIAEDPEEGNIGSDEKENDNDTAACTDSELDESRNSTDIESTSSEQEEKANKEVPVIASNV